MRSALSNEYYNYSEYNSFGEYRAFPTEQYASIEKTGKDAEMWKNNRHKKKEKTRHCVEFFVP